MAKAKKYRYGIGHSAEGTTYGYIELTKKEAAIVAYALDEANWEIISSEYFSGDAWIDINDPQEIPEK